MTMTPVFRAVTVKATAITTMIGEPEQHYHAAAPARDCGDVGRHVDAARAVVRIVTCGVTNASLEDATAIATAGATERA
jgi:hypothetical protein